MQCIEQSWSCTNPSWQQVLEHMIQGETTTSCTSCMLASSPLASLNLVHLPHCTTDVLDSTWTWTCCVHHRQASPRLEAGRCDEAYGCWLLSGSRHFVSRSFDKKRISRRSFADASPRCALLSMRAYVCLYALLADSLDVRLDQTENNYTVPLYWELNCMRDTAVAAAPWALEKLFAL